jgi:hypothetical protein
MTFRMNPIPFPNDFSVSFKKTDPGTGSKRAQNQHRF